MYSKERERYNQLIDHVGTHRQRRLTEASNKDSLVRGFMHKPQIATYPCKGCDRVRSERDRVMHRSRQVGQSRLPERDRVACRVQNATGYNQLVDHVGTHGQRRLTEALNKDSLVRQKD
ncbi:hypothetical protein Taro_029574, partial [Colocasia esculenta]|nr:hypothetical protein [Colocasia esculenta]